MFPHKILLIGNLPINSLEFHLHSCPDFFIFHGREPIHDGLSNYVEIVAAIKDINNRINGRGFNFREDSSGLHKPITLAYVSEDDKAIILLASFDFSYCRYLELVFYNVSP